MGVKIRWPNHIVIVVFGEAEKCPVVLRKCVLEVSVQKVDGEGRIKKQAAENNFWAPVFLSFSFSDGYGN